MIRFTKGVFGAGYDRLKRRNEFIPNTGYLHSTEGRRDQPLRGMVDIMESTGKYDMSNTMFSPEGRLFQVEYAREAIKKGSTVVALKYASGVIFMTRRPADTHRVIESSAKKLFRIDENIGAASSGLVADGRVLVDYCRYVSSRIAIRHDEPVLVDYLTKRLGNVLRDYSQHGGVRPFGVALFIGGIDADGIHLFETDISGAIRGYRAAAIGKYAQKANELLEDRYELVENGDKALEFVKDIYGELERDNTGPTTLEVMLIDADDGFSLRNIQDTQN